MRPRRAWLLAVAWLGVASCAPDRAPEAPRHRCIEIPNGLVECETVVEPGEAAR